MSNYSDEEKDKKIRDFIIAYGECMTAEQIMEKWKISRSTYYARKKEAKLLMDGMTAKARKKYVENISENIWEESRKIKYDNGQKHKLIVCRTEFMARLDEALIEAKDKGLKAKDIADKAGISPSLLSQYKNGYCKPGTKNMKALADALGKTPGWLYGADDEEAYNKQIAVLLDQLNDDQKKDIIVVSKWKNLK